MTAPRFAPCRCAHAKADHERPGLAPQCSARACTCLAYRPDMGRPAATPATPVNVLPSLPRRPEPEVVARGERGPSLESILHAGKRSQFKRTVALAEKIAVELNDLRGRLADEREAAEAARLDEARKAEAKAKIAELERQLAAARALLRGGTDPGPAPRNVPPSTSPGATLSISGERLPCTQTGCDRTFTRQQGLSRHLNETHGIRKDGAA